MNSRFSPASHRARPWGVLGAVAFANLVVAVLHFGLAATAPLLRGELGVDLAQLGVLLAAPPLGLMLGTFAWGELADRRSERNVLTTAFVGYGVTVGLAAWAAAEGNAIGFGAALLVSGMCGSAAHSAGGRAISAAFPPERHGLVLAIRHTAIPIGGAIGGLLLPALTRAHGLASAVAVIAVLGFVAALGIRLALPAAAAERAQLDAAGEVVAPGPSPLRERRLWLLAVGCGALAFVQLGVASFLTVQLVDEAGLALSVAAGLFALSQLVGAASRIVLGVWSDRVPDRLALLRGVALLAGGVALAAVASTSARVDGVLLVVVMVVTTSWNGVAVAAAAAIAPPGRTGATLGMQTTVNAAACTIAPIVLALVLHAWGWTAVELLLVAMLAAAVLALARAGAVRPSPSPSPRAARASH